MHSDHYQALGVHPQASQAEIRAAYLRLMRAHHPDRRPGDPVAADRARRANLAWEVLGDAARRASYDRLTAPGQPPRVRLVRAAGDGGPAQAYSPQRVDLRRAYHRASMRIGLAVFGLGSLLLLTVS